MVDRTCLQSCPSLHNVRKTRDCCVQATEGWRWVKEGGRNAPSQHEGTRGAVHGQYIETEMYSEGGLRLESVALVGVLLLTSNEYECSTFHLLKGWSSWVIKSLKVIDSI